MDLNLYEDSLEQLAAANGVSLRITADKPEMHLRFARDIADLIAEHNEMGEKTVLIMPVGPVKQYPLLAEICNRENISWKNVHTFNMDEYLDWEGRLLPEMHPLSFKGYMNRFFEMLNTELRIPSDQMHFPDPTNIDLFSERMVELGGIDCCYGGIGIHGHVAFNEPPDTRYQRITLDQFKNSKTRILPLAPETIVMNSSRGGGSRFEDFPAMAITVGMKDILASRRIRLYGDGGEWQKTAIRQAVAGKPDVMYPVTLLQGHPDYEICIDRETAEPAVFRL